jgi:DHA1 family multidrug resistance protein-like MFS transporter
MFVVLLLAQISASALSPIVAPYARSLLGPDSQWVATAAGAAIAVTGLAGLLSSPLLGRHSDRIGYRPVLLISILGAALFTLPQAISHTIWLFIVLRSGVGIFLGGIVPTANAWIGRLYPREQRGRVYGLTNAASSLGNFAGPLTGGIVAAHFGIPMVFIVVTVLMLLNFAWIALATRRAQAAA